ncbi:alpha/beta-hydrolase [Ascobolus immersus RN42]|uniref:Alpha/beta-hydrolase n=1 Tax=Ascobolus immersus RN42 TaxID=1160509 RepID=A0A3N4IMG9_ASCIM|nr:alpha/beta-hydrolase [Ascobolus immersus RN42]
MTTSQNHTKEEKHITFPDGHTLYTCTWKPTASPKAHVLFLHGFSDHSNAYYDFFPSLSSSHLQILSFDQRGWGKSIPSPKHSHRGRTGTTEAIFSDIDFLLQPLLDTGLPVFLIGHSMGGGLALCYGHYGSLRSKLSGIVVFSPLIEVHPDAKPPPKFIISLLKQVAKLLPHVTMEQKLSHTLMSRDESVCNAFKDDELCHDTGTLQGLAHMLDRGDFLVRNAGKGWDAKVPVLVLHGTGDRVTDWRASRRFSEQLRERVEGVVVEFRDLEGWFHKMHAEPGEDRARFAELVSGWILRQVGADAVAQGNDAEAAQVEGEGKVEQKIAEPELLAKTEAAPLVQAEPAKETARL